MTFRTIPADILREVARRAVADPTSLPPEALALALELFGRDLRRSFLAWCRFCLAPIGQVPARHHRLIGQALQDVSKIPDARLMLLLPPGSAKSTYGSDLFPPWLLARAPRLNVIAASHTDSLAESFGRRARDRLAEHGPILGCQLDPRGTAAADWQTSNGGAYYAVGAGAAVTGRRADLIVADDIIASREKAESERIRERTWEWFRADLLTRLKPGGRMVLIMTRWHPDDPAGRLLDTEPERWRVIRLPAMAEDADDPLGRHEGEALWPEWEDADALAARRQSVGEREWASLYQQHPRVLGGGLFRIASIPTVPAALAGGQRVRGWDLAATRQVGTNNPDWTAGVLLARHDNRYVVEDVVRERGGPEDVERLMLATASRDGRSVRISLPQDPGQAGKAHAAYLVGRLAGYTVMTSPETGAKETRAGPVASQANVGNVSMVFAPWNRAFLDELRDFPAGVKDDQVDALSRAFAALDEPQAKPARFRHLPFMAR